MEPLNYNLILAGGAMCALVVIGVAVTRPVVRVKPLMFRLGVWLGAGVLCLAGSQILGKGLVGWWPFLGPPEVFIRLVRVEVSPFSGRMAVVAVGGYGGGAIPCAEKLLVADGEGENIVEVCEGGVADICWSRKGEELYVLRRNADGKGGSSKSVWRYVPSTGKLRCLRELPRRTSSLSLDVADERLLLAVASTSGGEKKELTVCAGIDREGEDYGVGWQTGWVGAHTWGPKSGNIFVATNETSSFGEGGGLWMIKGDQRSGKGAVGLLEMQGIEEINLNSAETYAALVVRRWRPPSLAFDLYVLDVGKRSALPIAVGVELGSAVWDSEGRRLAFADRLGVQTYSVSTGRVRLLVKATASRMNPQRRVRLKPLSYNPAGDIVFQAGLTRVEKYDGRSGRTSLLLDTGRLRRYFKEFRGKSAA